MNIDDFCISSGVFPFSQYEFIEIKSQHGGLVSLDNYGLLLIVGRRRSRSNMAASSTIEVREVFRFKSMIQ